MLERLQHHAARAQSERHTNDRMGDDYGDANHSWAAISLKLGRHDGMGCSMRHTKSTTSSDTPVDPNIMLLHTDNGTPSTD
jgi:hypothetical protein